MTKGLYSYPKIEKKILNEPPELSAATFQRKGLKTSDFNMGTLDFLRYHELLKQLNRISLLVKIGRNDMLMPYYSLLDELYMEWLHDVNPKKQELIDRAFGLVEHYLNQTTKDDTDETEAFELSPKLKPLLRRIHREIFSIRKDIGISYPRSARLTARQKLKKALSV